MDDAAIVRSLLAGEPGAWDLFVERYAGVVAGAVRRILRGRGLKPSQADVDDLSENVFVMLLEKDATLLRRYDARFRLAAYLAVLARTSVHRYLRRRKGVDLPDDLLGEALPDPDLMTVSDETTQREVREAVRDELTALSEREQRILRLYYYEGQDYQQIAEVLGVSVNSVGAALSRARTRLAQGLRHHPDLTESDFKSL